MNVMFVNVSPDHTYPTGIGALSSFLRRNGHCTRLVDIVTNRPLISENQYAHIERELNSFDPGVMGFTVFETGFHWVRQISDFVKRRNPSIITVAGGYFPTLAPEEIINCDSVDVICRGEGEYALLELANGLESGSDIETIGNLWVKQNGKIHKNDIRPLIENLDDLPFWDREMFDYQSHLNLPRKGERNVKVMAARGCPYHCTYCSNLYFKELYPNRNKYFRMRTVGHVIEELVYLRDNFDFDYVGFHDDNLTLSSSWLQEFSEEYRKKVNIPFYCAARVETCSEKNLDYLRMAGCFMVLIGIESGDEKYRRNVMNRKMSNKLILDVCKRIKERKMLLWTFNMVGMPGETRRHLLKTALLNWRIGPDFAMTSIFYPFKGTEMGDSCYEDGIVNRRKKEMIGSYANDTILDHPNMSSLEMKIAKYLTTFSAMRSHNSFFYDVLSERVGRIFRTNLG